MGVLNQALYLGGGFKYSLMFIATIFFRWVETTMKNLLSIHGQLLY